MIIARYLSSQIALSVLAVMVGLIALLGFFDLINELDEVGKGAYRFPQAVAYVVLNLAGRAYEIMPIGVLIGAIYAFAQFASNSEFTAMRAAGLGRKEAVRALAVLAAILILATFVLGEVLVPPMERLADSIRSGRSDAGAVKLRSGAWIKDTVKAADGKISAQRFVNVEKLNADGSLVNIEVFEFDREFRLTQIISAAQAYYKGGGVWTLQEASIAKYTVSLDRVEIAANTVAETTPAKVPLNLPNSVAGEVVSSQILSKPSFEWTSELTPELFSVLAIAPDRMSALRLFQYINHLKDNQQRADRYEIAMWRKLIYPFVTGVMLILALPFAYLNARSGGIGYKVSAGVMMGVIFYFLNGLFSHIGLLNTWPAWMAASIPSLIATSLALFMLWWVDRA